MFTHSLVSFCVSCCYIFRHLDPPLPTIAALGTMFDDAGAAPDVAHSGGFLAAAVADPGLSAFGALGYLRWAALSAGLA